MLALRPTSCQAALTRTLHLRAAPCAATLHTHRRRGRIVASCFLYNPTHTRHPMPRVPRNLSPQPSAAHAPPTRSLKPSTARILSAAIVAPSQTILAAAMVDPSPDRRPTPSPLHTQVAELEHMTASTTNMAKVRIGRPHVSTHAPAPHAPAPHATSPNAPSPRAPSPHAPSAHMLPSAHALPMHLACTMQASRIRVWLGQTYTPLCS